MPSITLIYSTWPDLAAAREAAQVAVTEELAACANIGAPLESVYRWQGVVEIAGEIPVLFKTTTGAASDLLARLRTLHPYEIPCLIAWSADAAASHAPFTDWIAAQVRKAD